MVRKFKKAVWTLKEEGIREFLRKLLIFFKWAARNIHYRLNKYLPVFLRANKSQYDHDFLYLNNSLFKIGADDLKLSKEVQLSKKPKKIKTATWFVPYFNHLSFGGIYTIFRFIDYFSAQGVQNRIIIYDNPSVDKEKMRSEISKAFPGLSDVELVIFNPASDSVSDLPATDIAVCTFWVSAYYLLRFNKTKRKYYFVQDYEPLFYEGGSTYALAESTYRFGFSGIVNTPGLLRAVNQRHGMEGVSFTPAVDSRFYFPSKNQKNNKKIKIFFYARPNNPRNAFYLGIMIIKELLDKYEDQIEIVTAGAEWKEGHYDLKGRINNLGLLKSLDDVGELYRTCDIGFVYMLSKHPSYQPFEFMASGVATVTNNNEDNLWFLRDGTNCLIAEPSPSAMAEKIGWLIEDAKLRKKIQEGGYDTVSTDWDAQTSIIWNDICKSNR